MASEGLWILVALGVGLLLGLSYFGGLWFTIRNLPIARAPVFWVLSSFLVRTGISLLGFYLVMGHHWERLIMCVVGFFIMRSILVQRWGLTTQNLRNMKG